MRWSDLSIHPVSITLTAGLAVLIGVVAATSSARRSGVDPALMPVFYEEVTVVAQAERAIVAVEPAREAFCVGEDIVLIVRHDTDGVPDAADWGVLDLAVQRIAGPAARDLGGVTFLAVSETVAPASGNGVAAERTVVLGAGRPFDAPGRYRVSGQRVGFQEAADIADFEIVVHAEPAVATRVAPSVNPGA